ncbi:MAG TPA: prevent-host-death protein [Deltaproteobacteria bacterium]|nr:MAG: hypothetical protein A2048_06750 [Deltaproteobacteria bacterium GWA2_45_12]HBF12213.1 prevent-host-death protein [Deltaproteobacteria bacterium]
MKSDFNQDIIPVTELMHEAGKVIKKIRQTRRPVLITQNGRAAMVCMDVEEYQQQMKKLEFIDAILLGEKAFSQGDFLEWKDFEAKFDKI